jgi:radical SAM protein with 4Fe4S-binding SPASM domain
MENSVIPKLSKLEKKYFSFTEDNKLPIFTSKESWAEKINLCRELVDYSIEFNDKCSKDDYELLKAHMKKVFSLLVYMASRLSFMHTSEELIAANDILTEGCVLFRATNNFIIRNNDTWDFVNSYIFIDTDGIVKYDFNTWVQMFTTAGTDLKKIIFMLYEGILAGNLYYVFDFIKEYCCNYVKEKDDDKMDLSENLVISNKEKIEDLIVDYASKTTCKECFIKSFCRRQCRIKNYMLIGHGDEQCKEIIMQYIKEEKK